MGREKGLFKNKEGITLIALVVTIIVLIILAGVSISFVLGDNGIVTKAKLAKEQTEQAKLNEEKQLNSAVDYIEILGGIPQKENYAYDNPYIPIGFKHVEGTTWNNGFTIRGVSQNINDEFVWVPCVIDQKNIKEGDTVVTFGKTTTERYNEYNYGLLPTDTKVEAEDVSVAEIRESVEKYGGFYIAKYEAGVPLKEDGTKETTDNYTLTTKISTTQKPLSQEGCGVWNDITRADAIIVSKAMLNQEATGVKSTLISGEAWDTTLQWIVNASDNRNNEPNKNYDNNSKGKGRYYDVSSNNKYITGYYAVNNIYDMAGNMWDWTTENCTYNGSNYLLYRGGCYDNRGENIPASSRCYHDGSRNNITTFRVLLYK